MMKKRLAGWFHKLDRKREPDEFDAKELLKLYSIQVPRARRFAPGDPFDRTDIDPPYVLKVCSPDIFHKTELQGVMLNIDQSCVEQCFLQMQDRFPREKILLESQITFTGPEFIIGIINDPAMGLAVMVGAGGIFTEIYKDTAFRLAPCSIPDAGDMIDELELAPVFDNFRGMTLDKEKLAATISRVSELAHDMGDQLNQLDINPIVFCDKGWVALDVNILFNPA